MTVTRGHQGNSPADTRVLQAVHKTFRLATTRLVDATERLEPSTLQPIIGQYWQFYAGVLHHHHHTEDTVAFPALVAVRPDMAPLIKDLEEDHRKLVATMDIVQSRLVAFDKKPEPATQQDLHLALAAVRDEFFPHLDTEDAKVVPAFAQAIPPKDWERMDNQALKSIPRPYLPKAVGALDEVIRGLPEAERPTGPPPPIRFMLAVSWRRKWAEFVKPLTA
jgi:hemerythrin-like domain-containing protein